MLPLKRRNLIPAMSSSWLDAMYSQWMKRIAFAATLLIFQPVVAGAGEEEIEIHRSDEFTSPSEGKR